jgi:hypothetical protein
MSHCLTCQQPINHCSCKKNKTDNIIYAGPTLSCLGIETNDTLTVIIQKINTAFCSFSPTTTTLISTTTTTTTSNCDTWYYNIDVYSCVNCVIISSQTISNGLPLNIGSYYYSNGVGNKILVLSEYVPCENGGGGTMDVDPSTESATCAGVICPSTTTTTTTTIT